MKKCVGAQTFFSVALVVLGPGLIANADTSDIVPVAQCEGMAATDDRLRCYRDIYCKSSTADDADQCLARVVSQMTATDRALDAPRRGTPAPNPPILETEEIIVAPVAKAAEVAAQPEPQVDPSRFGSKSTESSQTSVTGRVVALIEQKYGEYLIRLDNGMVWEEIARTRRNFRLDETVTITRGFWNSYRLTGGQGGTSKVRRLFCNDEKIKPETAAKCRAILRPKAK